MRTNCSHNYLYCLNSSLTAAWNQVFHYLVFKQIKNYFLFLPGTSLTFVLHVRNTYTMTEQQRTQQDINTLRAKLFNKAEHILRELYRDDFQIIYAELCKEAGITVPRNDKDAVRARYHQLIKDMKRQEK